MIRTALFAALLVVSAAAAAAEPLKTAQVEMREVDLTYTAEAVVEAVRQSTVSAQIAGRTAGDAARYGAG